MITIVAEAAWSQSCFSVSCGKLILVLLPAIAKRVCTEIQEERTQMQKVRVAGFGVSLDGFSAGIEQSLSDPLGKRGTEIFQRYFWTKTFRTMLGQEGGLSIPTMNSHGKQWITLALSSSVATCSVPCAAHGWIAHGRAGGATSRRIIRQPSV